MKPIYFLSSMLFTMLLMIACTDTNTSQKEPKKTVQLQEDEQKYRPNFHFTPQKNWMNDPNGMFYWNGNYHLYFQHHPFGNVWGPMHWGHSVSKDLVHWGRTPHSPLSRCAGYYFFWQCSGGSQQYVRTWKRRCSAHNCNLYQS